MNRTWLGCIVLVVAMTSACSRHAAGPAEAPPKAFGAALVLVSGDKQAAGVGAAPLRPQ